jgi:transcriptional regulator with XRE-family HTH domain
LTQHVAMSSILIIIGANVRFYRKELRLSQEQLAEFSGLHRTYIGSVERGERNISALNIEKIAIVLGVDPAKLLEAQIESSKYDR